MAAPITPAEIVEYVGDLMDRLDDVRQPLESVFSEAQMYYFDSALDNIARVISEAYEAMADEAGVS
jgi:hypothetical protein